MEFIANTLNLLVYATGPYLIACIPSWGLKCVKLVRHSTGVS
jgi:hypothetical protein